MKTIKNNENESKKVLLLSIDGGGVRGAVPAMVLLKLEQELGQSIYDCFDMFAGTSTGAIISACIAAKKSSDQILDLYTPERLSKVMSNSGQAKRLLYRVAPPALLALPRPKFDGLGKRSEIKKDFGDLKLSELTKPTLITSYDFIENKAVVFKSIGGKYTQKLDPYVYQVCDASSAAPVFFPPVKVGHKWLIDGGIAANDPSMCLLVHALEQGYLRKNIYMISLGTGIRNRFASDPDKTGMRAIKWNGVAWMANGLLQDFMEGNSSTSYYQTMSLLEDRYCRLNAPLDLASDSMDDFSPENIEGLRKTGSRLYEQNRESILQIIENAKK